MNFRVKILIISFFFRFSPPSSLASSRVGKGLKFSGFSVATGIKDDVKIFGYATQHRTSKSEIHTCILH